MAVDGGSENGLRVFTALMTLLSFLFKVGFIVIFHMNILKGEAPEARGNVASRTGGTMNQINDDGDKHMYGHDKFHFGQD